MKHSFLDRYSDRDSFVHHLDPRTKFITTIVFILAVIVTPPTRWQSFVLYLLLLSIPILVSRVPLAHVFKRSLVIMPFVVMMVIFIPFLKGGEVAGSYNVWLWQVSVSDKGLQVLWNTLVKAWLCVLSLILLTSTTKMPDLLKGLAQLRLPAVMVMILSFMYRYIFVLVDEAMRLKQARDSRNFGGKRLWQIRTVANMIGTLFIRSYERGERIYMAMLSRGYDGQTRTLNQLNFRPADAYFGIIYSLALASVSGLTWVFI